MARVFGRLSLALFLTALSFVGDVAYLGALLFRRRVLAFVALYAGLSLALLGLQWGWRGTFPRQSQAVRV